jgi:hypothetical protein
MSRLTPLLHHGFHSGFHSGFQYVAAIGIAAICLIAFSAGEAAAFSKWKGCPPCVPDPNGAPGDMMIDPTLEREQIDGEGVDDVLVTNRQYDDQGDRVEVWCCSPKCSTAASPGILGEYCPRYVKANGDSRFIGRCEYWGGYNSLMKSGVKTGLTDDSNWNNHKDQYVQIEFHNRDDVNKNSSEPKETCRTGSRDKQICCPDGVCNAGTCNGGTRDTLACCPGGGACTSDTYKDRNDVADSHVQYDCFYKYCPMDDKMIVCTTKSQQDAVADMVGYEWGGYFKNCDDTTVDTVPGKPTVPAMAGECTTFAGAALEEWPNAAVEYCQGKHVHDGEDDGIPPSTGPITPPPREGTGAFDLIFSNPSAGVWEYSILNDHLGPMHITVDDTFQLNGLGGVFLATVFGSATSPSNGDWVVEATAPDHVLFRATADAEIAESGIVDGFRILSTDTQSQQTGWTSTGQQIGYTGQTTGPRDGLAVELVSFTATTQDGLVVLSWQTESEVDNEGFYVLRSSEPDGDYDVVGISFVPADGGPAFGADYELVDDTAAPGTTYYYLLEDIDTSGVSKLHGANACEFDLDSTCGPLVVSVPALSAADFCAEQQIRRRPFRGAWSDAWACLVSDWNDNEPDRFVPRDCKVARDRESKRLFCEATDSAD